MTTAPTPTKTVPAWLTPGEFLIRHRGAGSRQEVKAIHSLRDLDDKRPHVPLVKWDGTEWVMSVFDPHMFPRVRTTHSWSEALGWALTWSRINHGAGLL